MKNFVQEGKFITVVAPSGGVVAGTPVVIANLFGIPAVTALEGVSFALATTGVFTLTKKTTDVLTVGLVVYFDTTNNYVTLTNTSNYRIGIVTEAAGNGVTSVNVRLDGVSVVAV